MKSFMPVLKQRSRSPSKALAVRAMIGMAVPVAGAQRPFASPDAERRFETVEFGHLAVHQDEIEALLGGHLDRLQSVLGKGDLQAERFQESLRDQLVDGVVFDQQHLSLQTPPAAPAGRARQRGSRWPAGQGWNGTSNQNVEPCCPVAVDTDAAAHQADDLPGDRQAQPGAAVAPGVREVGLGKGVENVRPLFVAPGRCPCPARKSAGVARRGVATDTTRCRGR
jgi:hypothetical protein